MLLFLYVCLFFIALMIPLACALPTATPSNAS